MSTGLLKQSNGLVYDSKTQTYTELLWVNGVWTLTDGTVYRQVPLYDPSNLALEANRKETL